MFGQIKNKVGSILNMRFAKALLPVLYHRWKRVFQGKPMTIESYLYKAARVTGTSEYAVFCKSAESWPVAGEKIEQDFRAYLLDLRVPYYVTDFIRKNQKHLDALHIAIF